MRQEVFTYFDYRKYLDELTRWLKANEGFNLRAFAQQAGIKAPGYLKMVIDGRRNLKGETVHKFCKALNIKGRSKKYFEKLVQYNQAKNPDLKKKFHDELLALRPRSSDYVLEKRHSRYFSEPHYVTIREMVTLKDFREDDKWIAQRCFPKICPSEVRETIKTLLELGLLKRDDQGKLVQSEGFVKTQDRDTDIVETYHFHEAMLDRARYALGALRQKDRHFYALTLPLSKRMDEEIIDEFYKFRDKIVEITSAKGEELDDVYQINFQLFPATRKKGGES